MISAVAAFMATGLYVMGFSLMKVAAERMPPLYASQPLRTVFLCLTDARWLLGLLVFLLGLGPQTFALSRLPLSTAMPLFVASIVPLILVATLVFKERLTGREWLCLGFVAVSVLLVAMSAQGDVRTETIAATPALLAIVIPSLAVAYVIYYLADLNQEGRHARPVTGIAYGFSGGIAFGTAELGVRGLVALPDITEALSTPYPYVIVGSATVGFLVLQLALQRCRIAVAVSVGMITSKAHLLVMGGLLYAEPWPSEPVDLALRIGAVALVVFAVAYFPRYAPGLAPAAGRW